MRDLAGKLEEAGEAARQALRRRIVDQLGGELEAAHIAAAHDDGWFGPRSVAWTIHADACLLIGGVSALLRQTLHPLAMAGVAEHSNYESDPWGRLHRTSTFLADVVFGGSEHAGRCVERVRYIHSHIHGTAPDGRAYRADDPALLCYVHATEVDGFLRSYRRYGGGVLGAGEADRYVKEMARIAVELGATDVPETAGELRAYLEGVRGELSFGEQAERAVRFLREPVSDGVVKAGYQLILDGACALLPEPEATMLGVLRERERGRALRSGVIAARALRWVLGPSPVVSAARARSAES